MLITCSEHTQRPAMDKNHSINNNRQEAGILHDERCNILINVKESWVVADDPKTPERGRVGRSPGRLQMQVRRTVGPLTVSNFGLNRITSEIMRYFPIFYCLLSVALAVREKQLNLEDIERENLQNERRSQQGSRPAKEQPQVPQQYISPPQPNLQFQQYLAAPQLGLEQQYLSAGQLGLQQQYIPAAQASVQQQYIPAVEAAVQQQHIAIQQQQHISIPQQQHISIPQQAAQQQHQYRQPITPPKLQYGFKPMKTQPEQASQQPQYTPLQQHFNRPQQFFNYKPTQQQSQQQYIPPSRAQQYVQSHPNYQQVELPYISDNTLAAQDTNAFQQYYSPQLVYLQQYPDASNNVQTVVDPKGGVQYVMYLPSQYLQGGKAEQTQTVETLLQPQEQVYTQALSGVQGLAGGAQQYQYVEIPQTQSQVQIQPQVQLQSQVQIQPQIQIQAETPKFTDIQYVQQPEVQKSTKYQFPPQKYEPKSLLDSYVPSILQVQYFKQQQAQANAIQQSLKASQPITGKGDFAKNYVPQRPAQSFNFQYSQYASHPTQVVKH